MKETSNKPGTGSQGRMAFQAAIFFISYSGLRILLQVYLREERLPITYFFLLGLVSAIITLALSFVMKGKGRKTWIFTTMLLVVAVALLHILSAETRRFHPDARRHHSGCAGDFKGRRAFHTVLYTGNAQ